MIGVHGTRSGRGETDAVHPGRAGRGLDDAKARPSTSARTLPTPHAPDQPTSRSSTDSRSWPSRGGPTQDGSRSSPSGAWISSGRSLGLIVLSPLFAAVAVAIVLTDGRPILFRQPRVGLHGRVFHVVKFRTMTPDADAQRAALRQYNEVSGNASFKMTNDPRITRDRAVPAPDEHRRAAPALERPPRRDEPRRAAAAPARRRRRVRPLASSPPGDEARHHGPVAGRRSPRAPTSTAGSATTSTTSTTGRSGSTFDC